MPIKVSQLKKVLQIADRTGNTLRCASASNSNSIVVALFTGVCSWYHFTVFSRSLDGLFM